MAKSKKSSVKAKVKVTDMPAKKNPKGGFSYSKIKVSY